MTDQIIEYPKYYRRKEASRYLLARWSVQRAPSTLAKLAVMGDGPRFKLDGRTPLYPEIELDDWAQRRLSPLKKSTSDTGRGEQ